MKSKEELWHDLISQYATSGLSQEEFCMGKGIALNKFRYRWRSHMEQENARKSVQSIKTASLSRFEEVSILKITTSPVLLDKTSSISIQFPNQIRCELKMSVSNPEFNVLLKHLVDLC